MGTNDVEKMERKSMYALRAAVKECLIFIDTCSLLTNEYTATLTSVSEAPEGQEQTNILHMDRTVTENTSGGFDVTLTSYIDDMMASSTPLDVLFVLDASSSMYSLDGSKGDKVVNAVDHIISVLNDSGSGHRVACITFNTDIIDSATTSNWVSAETGLNHYLNKYKSSLHAAFSYTYTDKAMEEAKSFLSKNKDDTHQQAVVLVTDGVPASLITMSQFSTIVADVVETMENDHEENNISWNCGPVMAWEYFVKALDKEYEGKPDKPEILSMKSVNYGGFTVLIYDADRQFIENVDFKTATGEFLSFDCVNSTLTKLGYTELFENEEEMYAAFSGYIISDQYGIPVSDFIDRVQLFLEEDLAKVNVVVSQNGETVKTLTYAFKQGTQITSEVIQAKLAEDKIIVELNDVQINETAVNGEDFTLNVVLDSDTQETT